MSSDGTSSVGGVKTGVEGSGEAVGSSGGISKDKPVAGEAANDGFGCAGAANGSTVAGSCVAASNEAFSGAVLSTGGSAVLAPSCGKTTLFARDSAVDVGSSGLMGSDTSSSFALSGDDGSGTSRQPPDDFAGVSDAVITSVCCFRSSSTSVLAVVVSSGGSVKASSVGAFGGWVDAAGAVSGFDVFVLSILIVVSLPLPCSPETLTAPDGTD